MSLGGKKLNEPGASVYITIGYKYQGSSDSMIMSNGSGTLLKNGVIITAGHVITNKENEAPVKVQVELGSTNKKTMPISLRDDDGFLDIHPLYEEDGQGLYRSDIGIITVNKKVHEYIEPAEISYILPKVGDYIFVRGWGGIAFDPIRGTVSIFPDELREVKLKVVKSDNAIVVAEDLEETNDVESVVEGDSGGGVYNEDGFLIGVVSHRLVRQSDALGPVKGAQSAIIPLSYYEEWVENFLNN